MVMSIYTCAYSNMLPDQHKTQCPNQVAYLSEYWQILVIFLLQTFFSSNSWHLLVSMRAVATRVAALTSSFSFFFLFPKYSLRILSSKHSYRQ